MVIKKQIRVIPYDKVLPVYNLALEINVMLSYNHLYGTVAIIKKHLVNTSNEDS